MITLLILYVTLYTFITSMANKIYGLYTKDEDEETLVFIGTSGELAKYLGIPTKNISSYAKKGNVVLKKWRIYELPKSIL